MFGFFVHCLFKDLQSYRKEIRNGLGEYCSFTVIVINDRCMEKCGDALMSVRFVGGNSGSQ